MSRYAKFQNETGTHPLIRNFTSDGVILVKFFSDCLFQNKSENELFKESFMENIEKLDLFVHFLAFFGNLTSLIVLARSNIMGARMTQLLCLLTFSEVLYTGLSFLAEFIEHIAPQKISIYLEIFCKVCSHSFLSQRNWWIVVIGCIRYLVIAHPFKMKQSRMYSRKSLYIVFGFFMISWLGESVGLTCLFRVVVEQCNDTGQFKVQVWAMHDSKLSYRIIEGVAVFVRTFLPTILVSIFSGLTLFKLYWGSSVGKRKLSAATRTIFLLTLVFALFELPYGLTFMFCILPAQMSNRPIFVYYAGISQILVAMDSMCNIIIYCVSSPVYRKSLINCLRFKCKEATLDSTFSGTTANVRLKQRVDSEYAEEDSSGKNCIHNDKEEELVNMIQKS